MTVSKVIYVLPFSASKNVVYLYHNTTNTHL